MRRFDVRRKRALAPSFKRVDPAKTGGGIEPGLTNENRVNDQTLSIRSRLADFVKQRVMPSRTARVNPLPCGRLRSSSNS